MYLIFPEEIEDLAKIYEPYLVHGQLVNAPPEAEEALKKMIAWIKENMD